MVPTFWMWVRKNRRYGKHLREYVVNMREYVPMSWCLFLDVVRWYGRQFAGPTALGVLDLVWHGNGKRVFFVRIGM
jgi:hypothetical protein